MSTDRLMTILHAPHISEKATIVADTHGTYAFRVQPDATKSEIKRAVELMFDVQVNTVNVVNRVGKQKRFGGRMGRQTGYKKAYVTLAKGHEIHFGDEGGK